MTGDATWPTSTPPLRAPRTWLALVGVLLVTALAFAPMLDNGFTNWDDPHYVLENPSVTDLDAERARRLFTTPMLSNYHPLTMLSLALDHRIGGPDPSVFHRTNFVLHLMNTGLVFAFVAGLPGGGLVAATVVALLFGVHPMNVESVAWVTGGRKGGLYAVFFLLALLAYRGYRRAGTNAAARAAYYALTTLCIAGSLLSKPAAVVLPVALLLVDFLERRPLDRSAWGEKLPWFAGALALGIVTLYAQERAIADVDPFGFVERIQLACHALLVYLAKLALPVGLSAMHPYPSADAPLPTAFVLAPIAVAGLAAAAFVAGRRHRLVGFAALWFVVLLAPVLQLLGVGLAVYSERYVYLAYLGPLYALGCVADALWERGGARRIAVGAAVAVIALAFAVGTHRRTDVWQDSRTLWDDAIAKTGGNAVAFLNRGRAHVALGLDAEAVADLDTALARDPGMRDIYADRGAALHRLGRSEDALRDFAAAIEYAPDDRAGYLNRAQLYLDTGQYELAIADLDVALEIDSDNVDALQARGVAKRELLRHEFALSDFERALALAPDNGQLYIGRALVYEALGDWQAAARDARAARRHGVDVPQGFLDRLEARAAARHQDARVAELRRQVAARPDDLAPRLELAALHATRGEHDAAQAAYVDAIARWPCDESLRMKAAEHAHRHEGRAAQIAQLDALVSSCDASFEVTNELAYRLATAREVGVRDGRRAVVLARRAVEESDGHPLVLDTLAAAHAENGDFDAALEVARRALREGEAADLPDAALKVLHDHLVVLSTREPIRE